MSPDDRRRQLIGIGLRMLVERPIQELSVDAVAADAGISRGLLFHYFPTKTAFHDAVIDAATRRVLRNTAPDPDAPPEKAVAQFVRRFFEQVQRRRDSYLALVFGAGSLALGGDRVENLRGALAQHIVETTGGDGFELPVAHAWVAYVEDRALQWSDPARPSRPAIEDEITHCVRALGALRTIDHRRPD